MNFWDNLMGDDDNAGEYMLSYGEGPGAETRMVLTSFINDGESVLDVGCGPGWNMDHFAQFGPAVSAYKGVDYSIRFVRAANQRLKARLDENFTTAEIFPFELQDARDLKEVNGAWEVVIIQDCLEHTNGYERPMREALRVARRRVIVGFWHLMWEKDEDNDVNDDGDDGWGAWYSASKWEKYLDSLGYTWFHHQIIDHQNKPRDFYIIDKEEPR